MEQLLASAIDIPAVSHQKCKSLAVWLLACLMCLRSNAAYITFSFSSIKWIIIERSRSKELYLTFKGSWWCVAKKKWIYSNNKWVRDHSWSKFVLRDGHWLDDVANTACILLPVCVIGLWEHAYHLLVTTPTTTSACCATTATTTSPFCATTTTTSPHTTMLIWSPDAACMHGAR